MSVDVHPFASHKQKQHAADQLSVSAISLRFLSVSSTAYLLDVSQVTLTAFGGAFVGHRAKFGFILIRQDDIDALVEHPKILRDQTIIDFSRLQGLRTNEVATVRWRDLNLENGFISVLDSKKHVHILQPLHWRLTELLTELKEETSPSKDNWVIRPLKSVNVKKSAKGKPITTEAIADVIKWYAREAGVFDWKRYNSTLLRAYFAADWVRQKRSLKMLQYMMRHNSLSMTFRYVSKILFWSEIEREFSRVQTKPRRMKKLNMNEMLDNLVARQCLRCPAVSVCKYADEAVCSEFAEGCRFFRQIVEKAKQAKLEEAIKVD